MMPTSEPQTKESSSEVLMSKLEAAQQKVRALGVAVSMFLNKRPFDAPDINKGMLNELQNEFYTQLIDYAALGHFSVYEAFQKILGNSAEFKSLYSRIAPTTEVFTDALDTLEGHPTDYSAQQDRFSSSFSSFAERTAAEEILVKLCRARLSNDKKLAEQTNRSHTYTVSAPAQKHTPGQSQTDQDVNNNNVRRPKP
ncbi:MAG: hypothetical protein V4490_02710 [Pseudomonadota bacterium]